jgi:hypothetical protein
MVIRTGIFMTVRFRASKMKLDGIMCGFRLSGKGALRPARLLTGGNAW